MANKYVHQLRRGWKDDATGRNDWATYEATEGHMKPLEGELVLEYDNGVPRLKIGDGVSEFSQLSYMSIDSFILSKTGTITLYGSAWEQISEGRYAQDITSQIADKVTANSRVDLQFSPDQLYSFIDQDVAFLTINEDGQVKVYAIGTKPEVDHANIQVTITEVN